ncbi:MAG: hypothetical protein KatS3mg058_1082 [Roseiflexus sp.]|nr:MAG: hypothetical protein KatS3mg058_1082 [Roseiflexus sp.]
MPHPGAGFPDSQHQIPGSRRKSSGNNACDQGIETTRNDQRRQHQDRIDLDRRSQTDQRGREERTLFFL